jgi:hypothetical protein
VFQEEIVVQTVDTFGYLLPAPVKRRVEPLPILTGEILLGRPVKLFEVRRPGSPFKMMSQLVSQRFPGLAAPVELVELRQSMKRAVVENNAAQHSTR